MEKIILNQATELVFQSPPNLSYKFGYYNYSPFNRDGDKLLAHRISFEGRKPTKDDVVDIGYFSFPHGSFIKVAESNAFNWQQGSMLQWLGPDFNSSIIFNDVEGSNYVARIIDLKTGEKKTLPKAIYGVDPKGKFSVSLNFERCHFTRAYSYAPIVNEKWNTRIPAEDGIVRIDLETGVYKTIIGIQEFLDSQKIADDGETMHWFEHIMLNPEGNRFAFYHRYSIGSNYSTGDKYLTRCFTADIDGKNIWLHPNNPTDILSHLGWADNNRYAIYTYPKSGFYNKLSNPADQNKAGSWLVNKYRKIIRPLLPIPKGLFNKMLNPASYYAYTIDQHKITNLINPEPNGMDGHPSFTKNGRFMLTDTYADKNGFRHLLIYDLVKDKTIPIGRFYSFYNNCGWRADLHPRFSPDENYIIVDSTHNKHHQIVVLKVNWRSINF